MDRRVNDAIASWNGAGKEELASIILDSSSTTVIRPTLFAILRSSYQPQPNPIIDPSSFLTFLSQLKRSYPQAPEGTPEPPLNPIIDALADAVYFVEAQLEDQIALLPSDSPDKATKDKERAAWAEVCRMLLREGLIPTEVYDRFEVPFLDKMKLVANGIALTKKSTRKQTVAFFSLKKYNLLRESSEGFSLLFILLLGKETLGLGSDPKTGWDLEDDSSRQQRAQEVWKRVTGIIGYFDLDPSRTLDLILDIFISNFISHHRFFVDLLRCSTWGPSSASSPSTTSDATIPQNSDEAGGKEGGEEEEAELDRETGSTVAAQILGLKFQHYQEQTVMRAGEETPREMYLVAAIMVKQGLIKLKELWNHLSPSETEMAKHESRFRSSVNELARSSKGNALLASAAPLIDDDLPASASSPSESSPAAAAILPPLDPPDQKHALFSALLAVGAHSQTSYLLGRFPQLLNANLADADIHLRSITHRLSSILSSVRLASLQQQQQQERSKTKMGKQRVEQEACLTTLVPEPVESRRRKFTWFFPEWSEGLKVCESVDELFEGGLERELRLLGAHVGRDRLTLVRLVRLARKDVVSHSSSQARLDLWSSLIRLVFLPSLSLIGDAPTSHEIWFLVSLYPLPSRYGFYGFWKSLYASSLQLKVQGAIAEREAKGALRRVSKDDLKMHGRALGKLSHSDPTLLWSIALRQIQSYENLVKPVVESARFVTPLGADVVVYVLLDDFSNPTKDRTKTDGTSVSLWLKSLAAFAGELCRRHIDKIDCKPIVRYIANQLKAGNSKDLIILREIVSAMTGIDPLANLSDNQVASLSGGPTLQAEAIHPTVASSKPPPQPGVEVRAEAPVEKRGLTTKSSLLLLKSLEEERMLVPLLVVVAQARDTCVITVPEAEAHMKHLSSLFDSSTEVLLQYVEFLRQQMPADRYAELVPNFDDLAERYGLSPAVAFHILRPKLAYNIKIHDKLREKVEEKEAKVKEEARSNETEAAREARLRRELKDKNRKPSPEDAAAAGSSDKAGEKVEKERQKSPYHLALKDLISPTVAKYLPKEACASIGAPFFVTFWQLAPYDVEVPIQSYHNEKERLRKANDDLARYPIAAQNALWKQDREKIAGKLQMLETEREEQMAAYFVTKKRLIGESRVWFRKSYDQKLTNVHFYQLCVLPRALLSLPDAAYCAAFIKLMHKLGTQHFSSLWFHDMHTFSESISSLVASLTENEARNYARYMYDCFEELTAWHKDEAKYKKEALGDGTPSLLPGFRAKVNRQVTPFPPVTINDLLPWQGYRKVMHKWHKRLVTTFDQCVTAKGYMHIKNVVIVLQKLLPFFPRDVTHGEAIEKRLKIAIAEETREDLKLLLQSYSSQLGKLKKTNWIHASEFYNVTYAAGARTTSVSTAGSPALPAQPLPASDGAASTVPSAIPSSISQATNTASSSAASSPRTTHALPLAPKSSSAAPSPKPAPAPPNSLPAASSSKLNPATTASSSTPTHPSSARPPVAAADAKPTGKAEVTTTEKPLPSGPKAPLPSGPKSAQVPALNKPSSASNGAQVKVEANVTGVPPTEPKRDIKQLKAQLEADKAKAIESKRKAADKASSPSASISLTPSTAAPPSGPSATEKAIPRGPRGLHSSHATSASSPRSSADMQPPKKPSAARDAVDIRSTSFTANAGASSSTPNAGRDRSPVTRTSTSASNSRPVSPNRSSSRRPRSRSPPPHRRRSGSVESSHSTSRSSSGRGGGRRGDRDVDRSSKEMERERESEREKEKKKLQDREDLLNGKGRRPERGERDDRRSDRDGGRRRDLSPIRSRTSSRRDSPSRAGGGRSPDRDGRESKRAKFDKELEPSSSRSSRRSPSPTRPSGRSERRHDNGYPDRSARRDDRSKEKGSSSRDADNDDRSSSSRKDRIVSGSSRDKPEGRSSSRSTRDTTPKLVDRIASSTSTKPDTPPHRDAGGSSHRDSRLDRDPPPHASRDPPPHASIASSSTTTIGGEEKEKEKERGKPTEREKEQEQVKEKEQEKVKEKEQEKEKEGGGSRSSSAKADASASPAGDSTTKAEGRKRTTSQREDLAGAPPDVSKERRINRTSRYALDLAMAGVGGKPSHRR